MPDYQAMYLKMVRAARDAQELNEKAQQILIEAMQECEELYISEPECNISLLFPPQSADGKSRLQYQSSKKGSSYLLPFCTYVDNKPAIFSSRIRSPNRSRSRIRCRCRPRPR